LMQSPGGPCKSEQSICRRCRAETENHLVASHHKEKMLISAV